MKYLTMSWLGNIITNQKSNYAMIVDACIHP
jgi:hypothetical protein